MNSLAIIDDVAEDLRSTLLDGRGIEKGAFCLLREGTTRSGSRLLVAERIPEIAGAWELQGADRLRPSAQWVSAAVGRAIDENAGLLFVHSHPDPRYPVGLSLTDVDGFSSLARTLGPSLPGRFAAAVVHPYGWAGAVWDRDSLSNIDKIWSVGKRLRSLLPPLKGEAEPLDSRQREALGSIHSVVRSLTVAVVGCGGTGSPVAELLYRMGVARLIVVDPDPLDTPSNIRRVFATTMQDVENKTLKVRAITRNLTRIGLTTDMEGIPEDIRLESAFRAVLEADVVICATDNHGSRAVLNYLPASYLLPVIDIGARVAAKADRSLAGLVAEVRLLTPRAPCLLCRKIIDPSRIAFENLSDSEKEDRIREGYVTGKMGEPEPSVGALTVMASGMGVCGLIGILSGEAEVLEESWWADGLLGDSGRDKTGHPDSKCLCSGWLGKGDQAQPNFVERSEKRGGVETNTGGQAR